LEEGAVIVGSSSPFDYTGSVGPKALLEGSGVSDIKIYGKGVIEGGGSQLVRNADELQEKGYIDGKIQPGLISFSNGRNIAIDGIHLWNGPYHALSFSDCKNIMLENLDVNGNDLLAS